MFSWVARTKVFLLELCFCTTLAFIFKIFVVNSPVKNYVFCKGIFEAAIKLYLVFFVGISSRGEPNDFRKRNISLFLSNLCFILETWGTMQLNLCFQFSCVHYWNAELTWNYICSKYIISLWINFFFFFFFIFLN